MSGQAQIILPKRLWSLLPEPPQACSDAPCRIAVTAGISIREACEQLQLRLPAAILPLVNGTTQDLSYILQPDDEVYLLLQLSGGCSSWLLANHPNVLPPARNSSTDKVRTAG